MESTRKEHPEIFRTLRPEDLDQINDFVHDWLFDLENVIFDEEEAVLEIKFVREMFEDRIVGSGWLFKKIQVPIVDCFLRIYHVRSHEIVDTEKIGEYPFDTIEFEPESCRLSINTAIPLDFRVWVDRLEISIHRNKGPLRYKEDWMLNL